MIRYSLQSALLGSFALLATTSVLVGGCSEDRLIGAAGGSGGATSSSAATTGGMAQAGSTAQAGSGGGAAQSTSTSTSTGAATSTVAATTSSGGGAQELTLGGTLTPSAGKMVPAAGDVELIWVVTSGSPDYGYAFGTGKSVTDTFTATLAQPPAAALNAGGFGVGVVVLFPPGGALAEGKVPNTEPQDPVSASAIGASGAYAVIYRAPGAKAQWRWWSAAFPEGYSCGKGIPPAPGETFDGFEPVDCSTITITVDDLKNIEVTNWT